MNQTQIILMNDERVRVVAASIVDTLTDAMVVASGIDGFNYIALVTIVPKAMELAAQNARLTGPERREVVMQALLLMIDRAPGAAFGEMSRYELRSAAEVGIPIIIDLLYAAYKHRHVFRRSFARLRAKMAASCCRCNK